MRKGKKALAMALLLGVASGPALAGFAVVQTPAEEGHAVSPVGDAVVAGSSAGVTQVGAPAEGQPVVKGFAKEVSLLTALKQIVPHGWTAKRVGNLDVSKPVSWRGEHRVWVDVLHTMASTYGFSAIVDWDQKILTVGPAGMSPAVPTAQAAPAAAEPAIAREVHPVSAPGVKTWELQTDLTLKENVAAWCKAAGWTLSWAAADYPVESKVVLTGDLDADNGPIYKLSQAYSTAEQPITFTFWSNRVLRVENASYRQSPLSEERPNQRAMN